MNEEKKTRKILPLNRVEGDIEIHFELDAKNQVRQARCVGTLYRGIENLMTGRAPLDSLVITPRICGICTTAHLHAAAKALDMAFDAAVPDNARRLRNITLLVEQIQNDLRHLFLLFMPDFTSPRYQDQPLQAEAVRRYQVLKGETTLQAIQETKKILEIIAILGGQWPHSSFMVPGGVVSVPNSTDIAQCRHLLRNFRAWYERRVLGCSLARWMAVGSRKDLKEWLHASADHRRSDLGFFLAMGLAAGVDRLGRGCETFISGGGMELPDLTEVKGRGAGKTLWPSGVYADHQYKALDPGLIAEDISCSYYHGENSHPQDARTMPDLDNADGRKYSWAKAPRYDGRPAETGPVADFVTAGEPLFVEWLKARGNSVFLRELARFVRPAYLLPVAEQWLDEMAEANTAFYQDHLPRVSTKGFGLVPAPRGMLGHWVEIQDGKITNYQVVTPTAWNASPRDAQGVPGPCEQALLGTVVADPEHPTEVEQVVRSFDPCLVCTVHAVNNL